MSDISVEVCYALPDKQFLILVKINEGATVEAVILASGILALRDDVDLTQNKVGIFSRPAKLTDIVSDGDRVEIYRPLIADPKEMRRKRAAEASRKKKKSESVFPLISGLFTGPAGNNCPDYPAPVFPVKMSRWSLSDCG